MDTFHQQSPPPTITRPDSAPPAKSHKLLWTIVGIISLVALLFFIIAFRQGSYFQTKVFSENQDQAFPTSDEGVASDAADTDDYTKIEAYCAQLNEGCLVDCQQYSFEYQQHACNPECAASYTECRAATTVEQVTDFAQETLPPTEEGSIYQTTP
jgi:hypothetical protein